MSVLRVFGALWMLARIGLMPAAGSDLEVKGNGNSPEFVITTWQMPEGLPSDRVRAVLQTRDGYLWMATYNGVARFDGVHFRVFNDANTRGLRNRMISCLFEDSEGRLWIGSDTGEITWLDETGFHPLSLTNWPGSPIIRFAESADGALWALDRNGFLVQLLGPSAHRMLGNEAGPLYSDLVRDTEGKVWTIRYGGKVVRLSRRGEAGVNETPAPPKGYRTIAVARKGGLWMRDEERLRRWYHGKWVEDRGSHPWGSRQAVVLFESSSGDVWVGTREDGLFMIRADGSERHILHAPGLAPDLVSSIAEDREGNLWVGSDSGGVQRLRRRAVFMLNPPDTLVHRPVLSVSPALEGGVWVSAEGAGVYRMNGAEMMRLDASNSPTAKDIRTVLEDHCGRLWAGAEVRERLMSGVLVQDPQGRLSFGSQGGGLLLRSGDELLPFTNAVPGMVMPSQFYALYEDREGRVWMGSQNGLMEFQQDHVALLGSELYRPEVRCITETPDGALWLGMRGGGLARWQGGKFKQFLSAQGMPCESACALLGDSDGTVWIGTPGAGLLRYRNGRFASFTTRQGLPSDVICSILDDLQGHLWIASYAGIFKVSKSDLDRCASGALAAIPCFLLDTSDGLTSLEMVAGNQPSACRTPDGRLWFATSGGLARVDPERIRTNGLAPPVWLEEVVADGKVIEVKAAGNRQGLATVSRDGIAATTGGENQGARETALVDASSGGEQPLRALRLGPGAGQIELRYTALSFCDPQRVRFRYRLDKVDSDWVEAGARRSAYYSHLPPGQYQFRVMACNNDGVWNTAGASLALTVLPHFWETWWFGPLCWLGGISVFGAGVFTALRRRHLARIQALDQARLIERERGRIARDLHDDLGSGLTDIGMTSALALEPSVPAEEAREYLREIGQRSNDMVMALDEIVWAVNPKNDDVGALMTYFCQFAERLARLARLGCRFEIPPQIPELPLNAEQRHSLFLAFKEALQNAVKHSSGSNLCVRIGVRGGRLSVSVEDDGCGFEPGAHRAGADGLRNMRERLEQLGGTCVIARRDGGGTSVCLEVPVGKTGSAVSAWPL